MKNVRIPHLNLVTMIGNLTADPRTNVTTRGIKVSNFHIAINKHYRTRTGETKEDVCFVGIVAWDYLAESCEKFLEKGSTILVNGALQSRSFNTADGAKRTVVEVKARNIEFLRFKQDSDEYLPCEDSENEETIIVPTETDRTPIDENIQGVIVGGKIEKSDTKEEIENQGETNK